MVETFQDLVSLLHKNVDSQYAKLHSKKQIIEYCFHPLPFVLHNDSEMNHQLVRGFAYAVNSIVPDTNHVVKVGSEIMLKGGNSDLEKEVAQLEALSEDEYSHYIRIYYKVQSLVEFKKLRKFFESIYEDRGKLPKKGQDIFLLD